jgi:hypothetical protein
MRSIPDCWSQDSLDALRRQLELPPNTGSWEEQEQEREQVELQNKQ